MKHVLLIGNIDGQSISLLRYASKFCKNLGLRLHILQIEPDNTPVFLSSPYYFNKAGYMHNPDNSKKNEEFESFVSQNTKDIIDSTWISSKLMRGNVQQCLDKFVNEEKIDLIIARQAIFKRSDLEDNQVFKELFLNVSNLPMLIIPDNQTYEPLRRLAYLTTFCDDDYINIKWTSEHFERLMINLIHFSSNEETLKEQKWLKYLKAEIEKNKIIYKKIDCSIEYFVNKQINIIDTKYDLMVLTTHYRNFWTLIIDPSTTLSLITKIEIPTLIFKYNSDKKIKIIST